MFRGDAIVADDVALRILDFPIADPEIELMIFGGFAGGDGFEDLFEVRVVFVSREFGAADDEWAGAAGLAAGGNLFQEIDCCFAIALFGLGTGFVDLIYYWMEI